MSFIQRAKSTAVTAIAAPKSSEKLASRLVYLNESKSQWVGYDEAGLWPLKKAAEILGTIGAGEGDAPMSFLSPDPSGDCCIVSFK